MRRLIWVGLVVLCLVCGLKTSSTSAQAVYGSILGTVTDPQGSAVAGAKVTVTSITKGTTETTTSNESGNYSVTHLIPDSYKIRIEATGFKATNIPSVQVSADTGARVDATLQVGEVTQSVEVLCGTTLNERPVVPTYGLTGSDFYGRPGVNDITQAVQVWEPRAAVNVSVVPSDSGESTVSVLVSLMKGSSS